MANYIGVVHKDADSDYGVSFPDFPGCITAGSTIDEASDMAHEALQFHIEGMIGNGYEIPAPSSLESIMADPDFSDGIAYMVVSVSDKKSRTVRINVTVPDTVLKKVDEEAKKRGVSRSAFLVDAAQNSISHSA
jgi:predicted RNase H-like HicB family nuclease